MIHDYNNKKGHRHCPSVAQFGEYDLIPGFHDCELRALRWTNPNLIMLDMDKVSRPAFEGYSMLLKADYAQLWQSNEHNYHLLVYRKKATFQRYELSDIPSDYRYINTCFAGDFIGAVRVTPKKWGHKRYLGEFGHIRNLPTNIAYFFRLHAVLSTMPFTIPV